MIINDFKDTFNFFKSFYPPIVNDKILDYGCNCGIFLSESNGEIRQENYTGIDVDADAIKLAQNKFPNATFVHYNAHNYMYNPQGIKNIQLPHLGSFDTIISYSVFTHTTEEDFLTRIYELHELLKEEGRMLFSYCDIDDLRTTEFFYKKRLKKFGSCDRFDTSKNLTYLVDNKIVDNVQEGKMLLTLYKTDYLKSVLKNFNTQFFPSRNQLSFQNVCVIKK